MQSALRFGRIGPLTVNLNYTWLLAATLMLWWLSLLWLPDNFPDKTSLFYWIAAIAVLIFFFASVIVHELVHNVVAGTGRRNVNLFPFGAGMPFGALRPEAGRALVSSLAGPIFSVALGMLLLALGSLIEPVGGLGDAVRALAVPLGRLNIALGLVNLIPGIPFDGGWAIRSLAMWFSDDRESGSAFARTLGSVAALAFIVAGAWFGLSSDSWLLALTLVLIGWAAREASASSRQRGMLRDVFEQLQAQDFMDEARPADEVMVGDTVADMARQHRNYAPNTPLPVIDGHGQLVGIVTMGQANKLLQGMWPTTPVTALMRRTEDLRALPSHASLNQVLSLAEQHANAAEEDSYIPIIERHRLVGSINPNRLHGFEQVGEAFGIDDPSAAPRQVKWFSTLRAVIPVAIIVAVLAILGNLAVHANPAEPITIAPGSAKIRFDNFSPADGSIVGIDTTSLSVQAVAASPITSGTIMLDGQPFTADISNTSQPTQTLSANLPGITQGVHTVSVTAVTESGKTRSTSWQFRASARSAGGGTAGQAEPTSESQPVQVAGFRPSLGGRVLAGAQPVPLSVIVQGLQPKSARFYVDGQVMNGQVTPVQGAQDQYAITASAPALDVGTHVARVEMQQDGGGTYASSWVFSALKPDANNVYFKETGYFIAQPFLQYWHEHGGLAAFGYPISYRIQETSKDTGETYTAQYFERARFELHAATGDQVILGRLGAILHPLEAAASKVNGAQFFPETGHNLSGPFLSYWQEHGGLAVFGYPISEEHMEKNPIDGKEYKVQYFERNRFELHPEKQGTPYEVQLGLLGTQLYNRKYGQ